MNRHKPGNTARVDSPIDACDMAYGRLEAVLILLEHIREEKGASGYVWDTTESLIGSIRADLLATSQAHQQEMGTFEQFAGRAR